MRAGGSSIWPRPPDEAADEALVTDEPPQMTKSSSSSSSSSSSNTESGRGRRRRLSRNSTLGIECFGAEDGGARSGVRLSSVGRLGQDG